MRRPEPLRAGDLREQIRIEAEQVADNGRGGRTKTWELLADGVWAEVIPLRGDEALQQGILRGTQFWRVTIRYRAGITTTGHRLVWGDTVMNIKAAARNRARDGLVMTCESGGIG